jgi:hypothetical protein
VPGARVVGPILTARVLDVGPGGAHIETATALRVGARYALTLQLPRTTRRLRGQIRWCRLVAIQAGASGERRAIYRAGVVWGPLELPAGCWDERE